MKKTTSKKIITKKTVPLKKAEYGKNYFSLIGLLVIVLLGSVIYSNSFNCSFHFDDIPNIVSNSKIHNLWDVKGWWKIYPTRPVAIFSFGLNYLFNGLNVWGFHLVNLIIHLINACLVWWLTLLIFSSPVMKDHKISPHKKAIALITALLFVSHPLATQSVTYIVQRMSSMAALFYLLSITLYITGRITKQEGKTKYLLFAGAIFSAILAIFTKENAYTLPVAILLVEFFFLRTKKFSINFKDYRQLLLLAGFIGMILVLIIKFSSSVFHPILPEAGHTYTVTSSNYLLTQFSVIIKYLQLLLLPMNQRVDYDFPISNGFFEIRTLISFLFLTALVILGIFLFKRNRIISFGIFWFFLTLSVESSFIPITDLIFEHRTYLPSFGFFLILSSTLYFFLYDKYRYLMVALFAIIIVSNSFLTFERNKVWKDDLTLWSDNVSKEPLIARPVSNRGFAYSKLKQWDKAIADYTKAIKINPVFTDAYSNRGAAYETLKQWDMAIADYSKAIEISPKSSKSYSNRGAAYLSTNQLDKAMSDFSKAININPDFAFAYYNRGNAFESLREWNKAIEDYDKALGIDPNLAEAYYNRGICYRNIGQWDKAIADCDKAKRINPEFSSDYYNSNIRDVYYSRATDYSKNQQWNNAIADFTASLEIDPNYAKAYSDRGIAYAHLEKWDKAIADFSGAITKDANFTEAYFNRGNAYAIMKQWEKAIDDFNSALRLDPTLTIANTNREIANRNWQSEKSK